MTTNPHEAVYLNGKKINWHNPPKPTTKVKWTKTTMYGRPFYGSFRTVCAWNRLNNLSIKRFGVGVTIIQPPYNSTVAASKGTHDYDAMADWFIAGVDWWTMQRFARANGFMDWYRRPPLFGNHQHGAPLPPAEGRDRSDDFRSGGFKVGVYVDGGFSLYGRQVTSSQLDDYWNHRSGLSGHAHDSSWFPPDIEATIFDLRRYVKRRQKGRK